MEERNSVASAAEAPARTATVELTDDELELLRNALRALESIMGHEEADTLKRVQRLLAKLAR